MRVEGLQALNRSFAKFGADVKKSLRDELKVAAEPVRSKAAGLASANIENIGPRWGQMRVGVTTSLVYVAPKSRRRGGSPRSNLGGLLMDRAMQPALDEEAPKVVALLDVMLSRLAGEAGF